MKRIKNMEEIKINVSIKVWIYILLAVAACFAIIMGVSRVVGGPGAIGAEKYHMITMFICITSIFLVPAYIQRKTKLVVTDVQLRVNVSEPWVVQLSGVESFYVDKFKGRTFIGIRYKEGTWEGHKENSTEDRKRRLKAAMQGYPYEIYVSGLTMKPQEICDLLNSRINK